MVSGEDKHQSLGNYVYKRYVNHSLGGMISNILRYMYFYRKYIENLIYIIIIHITKYTQDFRSSYFEM